MKTLKKTIYVLAALLPITLAVSCSTTGEYMPLKDGETVIGTVQETLIVRSTFFNMKKVQDGVNTEAYIKLLEAAERKYPKSNIDMRDIVWVTGEKTADNMNTKIFVTGKVIRIGPEEAADR
jgi:phage terminase large subunit-like protein